ncbi:MAG TPA: precorrin-8X methylmutase [Streptosporangiaceae bacterium]|nr:precorrin-8X methylmutase [Streptosporangiaceae bacterium]
MTWPTPVPGGAAQPGTEPGEAEAYRILRSRIDLSRLPKYSRDVTERIIYATADFDYATDLVCDEEALAGAVDALAGGARVVADTTMVAAGITGCPVVCKIGETLTARLARTAGISRPAAAVRLAFGDVGPGAVWVVGGEPAALTEILYRGVEPAFVVGMPVGFVAAAEAKDALRASGIASVSNVSEKGGAAVATAAFDALLRSAVTMSGSRAAGAAGAATGKAPPEDGR